MTCFNNSCHFQQIYGGNTRLAKLSGNIKEEQTFLSDKNDVMVIRFVTDRSLNMQGFRGIFRSGEFICWLNMS